MVLNSIVSTHSSSKIIVLWNSNSNTVLEKCIAQTGLKYTFTCIL